MLLSNKFSNACLFAFVLAGAGSAVVDAQQTMTQVINGDPDWSTLAAALTAAGFDGGTQWSMFLAPNNAAFNAIPATYLTQLTTNPYYGLQLRDLLGLHVTPSANAYYTANDIIQGNVGGFRMRNGVDLTASGTNGVVTITGPKNSVQVTMADMAASNGLVHKVDNVLLPPWIGTTPMDFFSTQSDFSIFYDLMNLGELGYLMQTTPNLSFFPPTNAAFQTLATTEVVPGVSVLDAIRSQSCGSRLREILENHILNGMYPSALLTTQCYNALNRNDGTVCIDSAAGTVNGNQIIQPDIITQDNVIHPVGTVMIPSTVTLANIQQQCIAAGSTGPPPTTPAPANPGPPPTTPAPVNPPPPTTPAPVNPPPPTTPAPVPATPGGGTNAQPTPNPLPPFPPPTFAPAPTPTATATGGGTTEGGGTSPTCASGKGKGGSGSCAGGGTAGGGTTSGGTGTASGKGKGGKGSAKTSGLAYVEEEEQARNSGSKRGPRGSSVAATAATVTAYGLAQLL